MKQYVSYVLLFVVFVWGILLSWCMHHANDDMADMDHGDDWKSAVDPVQQLSDSPRHQERVELENEGKKVHTWVVYPEASMPAPVVVVIHENKWLTDRVRSFADELAAEWYIVLAPDLLSDYSETYTKTADFPTPDEATKAIWTLELAQVMSDLQVVYEYAKWLESTNGTVASLWFCRWGAQSFNWATSNSWLAQSFVFYGTAPADQDRFASGTVPVVAFYGWNDQRVNATITQTEENMKAFNIPYSYEIYEWAGHAFMRLAGEVDALPENVAARDQAWDRLKQELQKLR